MSAPVIFCAGANIRDLPGKYVDSVLVNVVDNFANDNLKRETGRMIQSAAPRNIMLDSGGYPLLRAEENGSPIMHDEKLPIKYDGVLNLTPHHVVKVARQLLPHNFVNLDFPIRKISDQLERESEFYRKLEFNVPWAVETAKLRQQHCPGVGLYISIQCYNAEQLEVFLRAIDGIHLDGFSMPIRTLKLPDTALFMIRIYQLGIKKVHLLGVTEFFTLALAAYMARHYFERVSLDSRTWKIRAAYSTYLNPHDLMGEDISPNLFIDDAIKIDCKCPWCKGRSFNYIKSLPYTDRRVFLGCHNFWVTANAARNLYQNSQSISTLEKYLKRCCRYPERINELIETLILVETMKDKDIRYLQEELKSTNSQ